MDDNKYNVAFELILNAGDAKSKALEAIEAARSKDFELAESYLREAEEKMREAHRAQVEMIQEEAAGNAVDVNIILVHAQDHLTMALMSITFAEEFINLYKDIKN